MSTKPRFRSRKAQPIAAVITCLNDVHAVVHWIARLRADLAAAVSAPGGVRRAMAFQGFWLSHGQAQKRLDGIAARVCERAARSFSGSWTRSTTARRWPPSR